jgi:hypothetical protein
MSDVIVKYWMGNEVLLERNSVVFPHKGDTVWVREKAAPFTINMLIVTELRWVFPDIDDEEKDYLQIELEENLPISFTDP